MEVDFTDTARTFSPNALSNAPTVSVPLGENLNGNASNNGTRNAVKNGGSSSGGSGTPYIPARRAGGGTTTTSTRQGGNTNGIPSTPSRPTAIVDRTNAERAVAVPIVADNGEDCRRESMTEKLLRKFRERMAKTAATEPSMGG